MKKLTLTSRVNVTAEPGSVVIVDDAQALMLLKGYAEEVKEKKTTAKKKAESD